MSTVPDVVSGPKRAGLWTAPDGTSAKPKVRVATGESRARNLGRRSRRFYRPLSSCTSHMPLTCINASRGQIPVRCRPSGVRATLARAAHGQGRARSRTPGQGAVTLTVRVFRVPRCPGVHPAERGRVLLRAARVALARCHQAGRHRGRWQEDFITSSLKLREGAAHLCLSARPGGSLSGWPAAGGSSSLR